MQSSCQATPFFLLSFVNVRAIFHDATYFRISGLWITTVVYVYMKDLVMVNFLSGISKTTGFPSPIISMIQRTAIRVLVSLVFNNSPQFAWEG